MRKLTLREQIERANTRADNLQELYEALRQEWSRMVDERDDAFTIIGVLRGRIDEALMNLEVDSEWSQEQLLNAIEASISALKPQ